MKAVILAQGAGTRMFPISIEIPKPLIPVNGKPIINYVVDMFLNNKVKDFAIPILAKDAENFLWWKKRYYKNKDIFIKFYTSNVPKGTYFAMSQCLKFVDDGEPFWVSNSDEIMDFNLSDIEEFHKGTKSLATIVLTKVNDTTGYGIPSLGKNNLIESFVEKPNKNKINAYINSGLYIFNPKIFKALSKNKRSNLSSLEMDVFPWLIEKKLLSGFKTNGIWVHCGNYNDWKNIVEKGM